MSSSVFNKNQLQAIAHKTGPAMVIAGPGSGKTTVITNRVKNLIDSGTAWPQEILVITFTVAAASEMKARYLKLCDAANQDYSRVTFGTFHSVFYQFLRRIPGYSGLQLAEPAESIKLLKAIVHDLYPDASRFTSDYYTYILNRISYIKNTENINNMKPSADSVSDLSHRIITIYQQKLLKRKLIDFDDMLVLFNKCLAEDAGFRALMRRRFRFILIDEFQDINRVQFEAVRILAAPLNNLFVVGDDDQSIYAFRGSDPSIMLRFREYYQDARFIELFTNYRSSRDIIRTASRLISHNKERYNKQFEAVKELRLPVATRSFKTQAEEAEFIVSDILKLPKELKTVGILYRTHRTGSTVKEAVPAAVQAQLQAKVKAVLDTRLTDQPLSQTGSKLQTEMRPQAGSGPKSGQDISLGDHQISFMTFHACKGLEFDAVYIISANEDITPSKSSGKDGISEERRLFYVAMTRAKQFLHISDTRFIYNKSQCRSRFVREAIGARAAAGDIFRSIIKD